jgi:heme-degrading monooxygenase HmoA
MITVGMNYSVRPGKDEQFLAVFNKVRQIIGEMDGHRWTKLYRDVDSAHDYLLISEWSSEEQFRAFIASERFRNVADWGKENILAARPTHEVYGASRPLS